ncbi:hypothetical protein C8R46DRAFT_1117237 [Mycena filopes]|nr:hypothetical protein C8R46DRAFT_1117237 [Mycena filopes]
MVAAASCSLLDLPTELLVEIVFHYPNTFTFLSPFVRQEHTAQRQDREQVLRSLCHACSRLRNLFLPILWEQFYASKPNFRAIHTQSEFSEMVAPYIKTVHVAMNLWSPTEMEAIFLFLDFIRSLPNLTGLQIHRVPWAIVPLLTYAFNGVRFPTVTALSVPNSLDVIFPSFPNVTHLASPEFAAGNRLIPALTDNFPRLGAVAGLRFDQRHISQSSNIVKALSAAFPHLRALSVTGTFSASYSDAAKSPFEHLRVFTNLSELNVVFDEHELPLEALVEGCKAVLLASSSPERKALLVWVHDQRIGLRVLHEERW